VLKLTLRLITPLLHHPEVSNKGKNRDPFSHQLLPRNLNFHQNIEPITKRKK